MPDVKYSPTNHLCIFVVLFCILRVDLFFVSDTYEGIKMLSLFFKKTALFSSSGTWNSTENPALETPPGSGVHVRAC